VVLAGITGMLSVPDLTARDAAEVVRGDPVLSARVLRMVNSPFYGLGQRISTVSHAAAMLAPGAIRRIAGGIRVTPAEGCGEVDPIRHRGLRHSVAVAGAAEALARDLGFDLPEEAFVAGLLHDLGRMVLDARAPADYLREVGRSGLSGRATLELESALFGMDHCRAGALAAERWNLPGTLRDAVELHHEETENLGSLAPRHGMLVRIVAAADRICGAHGFACFPGAEGEGVDRVPACGLGLSASEVAGAVAGATAAVRWLAHRLGFEGDLAEEMDAVSDAARAKLCVPGRGRSLLDRLKSMVEVRQQVHRGATRDEILSRVVRLCRQEMDFDRVLYLEMDGEGERLVGRFHSDETSLDADLDAIRLAAAGGRVGAAIRDGIPMRADDRATDGGLLALLGHPEAVLAPVCEGRKVVGLLCADTSLSDRDLTDADAVILGLLAFDAGLAVEHRTLADQTTQLRALAIKDELTGVNNRRHLMDRLASEIDRALRYGSPLSVVMVDIDHFKVFNDTLGHLSGDVALTEVAQVIVSGSRDVDVIGRYGGEEFFVVLPETSVEQGIVYAERLRKAVEDWSHGREGDGPYCPLTISAGVTAFRRESDDLESLLRRVDDALYAAKARGRNRVCVA
jgi:diguanylate cyclase (GGDEF)-like protein/putative nucleotidyltransferase with HDIG domain